LFFFPELRLGQAPVTQQFSNEEPLGITVVEMTFYKPDDFPVTQPTVTKH